MNWLLNQWWFKWMDQWWLQALAQACGVTWLLGLLFPSSGLGELSTTLARILGYVVIATGVVQGTMWLWHRRRAEG